MAEITAALVKELRERTGSGMMECKKALQETNGDIEAAIELMRKQGLAKADKKAGRTAAEGLIVIRSSADGKAVAMVEINCETDFVAKGDDFQAFANAVAEVALNAAPADLDALLAAKLADGQSVDDTRRALVAKIGENMAVRRFVRVTTENGRFGTYLHGSRIGVVVEVVGGSEDLAKDLAMHIAASRPVCVEASQVPAELVAKEREIFSAQAAESGKPADIVAKMVEGRVQKFLKEVTLLGQPFVKDPEQSVEKLLKSAGARVLGFYRFELGEGIEKKQENFAAEVMAQVRGG
ncbi:MAG TPA: translation elongation factor Ts [Candidatus Competibacteraceae bacterium]|nr:translation elongation factor Ts [Candidatus Competibacteraceae bacterium]